MTNTTCLKGRPIAGAAYTGSSAWTGGARSIVEFGGDCWFGWEYSPLSIGVIVGLANEDTGAHYNDITHAFRFDRNRWSILESGVKRTVTAQNTQVTEGDRFYVYRFDSQVVYCIRPVGTLESKLFNDPRFPGLVLAGPIVYVSTVNSYGIVFLDTSLYTVGDFVTNPVGSEFRYYAGAENDRNINSDSPLPATIASISGELEFSLVAGDATNTVINGDLVFSGVTNSVSDIGASGELKFTGLASDTDLQTRVVGSLILEGDASQQGLVSTISGAVGFLRFQTEARTSDANAGAIGYMYFNGAAGDQLYAGSFGELKIIGITQTSTQDNSFFMLMTLNNLPGVVEVEEDIQDTLLLTDDFNFSVVSNIVEPVYVSGAMLTFAVTAVELLDQAMLLATVSTKQTSALTDTLSIQDTCSLLGVIQIAEELVANDSVQNLYHGVVQVLASMLMADSERNSYPFVVQEYVTFSEEALTKATYLAEQLETIMATAVVQNVLTIVVDETAELMAADSIELTAKLFAELLDTVDIYTLFKVNDDLSQAWVMNTEAGMPISEYDNYLFTSMTTFKGRSFGTTDSGLFELEGDTDIGEPITAQVESMMLDFGTSRMKRIRTAYMGYTSSNELVLKVMSVDDGELFEHWYKASPVGSNTAPRTGMVEVGQGLRSRYWQFELTNVDGGDFELDVLELYPLFLGRRV
tara:strand:- start:695 stop:2779 length:2085 start_codon:yes stop_codon:yes gene_type:complete